MKRYQLLERAMRDYPAGTVARFGGKAPDHISTGKFEITDLNHDGNLQVMSMGGLDCFYADGEWAVPVTKSILSGKCAIQVNNEREFKLLMEHYESKGWESISNFDLSKFLSNNKESYSKIAWVYKNNYDGYSLKGGLLDNCSIIPFDQFAQEVAIKVPVFVMTSEDGVDLYEGDEFYHVSNRNHNNTWKLNVTNPFNNLPRHIVMETPISDKAFTSKEAAEKWITEHNRPNEIVLFPDASGKVTIRKYSMDILGHHYSNDAIEQIYIAHQSLQ